MYITSYDTNVPDGLLFKHFGCTERLLFKHFGCKASLLFKHFGCQGNGGVGFSTYTRIVRHTTPGCVMDFCSNTLGAHMCWKPHCLECIWEKVGTSPWAYMSYVHMHPVMWWAFEYVHVHMTSEVSAGSRNQDQERQIQTQTFFLFKWKRKMWRCKLCS